VTSQTSRRIRTAALFAVLLPWAAGEHPATRTTFFRWPIATRLAAVDANVARLRIDQPDTAFVKAIAADFDGDGDVDVVTSSAVLETTLWENNGEGHFSRRAAVRSSSIAAGDPAVAKSSTADPPPGVPPLGKWWPILGRRNPLVAFTRAGERRVSRTAGGVIGQFVRDTSPRGPPAFCRLTCRLTGRAAAQTTRLRRLPFAT
jgi:hypothetical protein